MTKLCEILMLKGGGVISLVGAGGKTTLMFRIARELSKAGETVLTTTTTKIFMPSQDQSQHVIISASYEEVVDRAKFLLENTLHVSAGSGLTSSSEKLVGFQPESIDKLWRAGIFRWILTEADGAARRPLKAPASHEPVIPGSTKWLIGVVGLDAAGKKLDKTWVFRPEIYADITRLSHGDIITEESIALAIAHESGIMRGAGSECKKFVFLNKADIPGGLMAGQRIAEFIRKQNKSGLKRVIIGSALHDPVMKLET
ncbi:MAG: putative selenium-dependent hydroxylase accessory protein YqeC [Desulfobacteraceae bacterium]|nr:putative selenium-dependent hydroxylase accessory protein YqeC [Desulfobacteraceae bacterium]